MLQLVIIVQYICIIMDTMRKTKFHIEFLSLSVVGIITSCGGVVDNDDAQSCRVAPRNVVEAPTSMPVPSQLGNQFDTYLIL